MKSNKTWQKHTVQYLLTRRIQNISNQDIEVAKLNFIILIFIYQFSSPVISAGSSDLM